MCVDARVFRRGRSVSVLYLVRVLETNRAFRYDNRRVRQRPVRKLTRDVDACTLTVSNVTINRHCNLSDGLPMITGKFIDRQKRGAG